MRTLLLALIVAGPASAAGSYTEIEYPPSDKPGELAYGVTCTLWLPADVKTVRGVIVHQHGCGKGACEGGATAAYDLYWQALAAKWDCALLGPSYHQGDAPDCRRWCDPRNGSEATFLRCLKEFAAKTKHPEIETAPWCLWGHSGGGFWASIMMARHPERTVAVWCRSGTAFEAWQAGDVPGVEVPNAVYGVPLMLNPGMKEKGDKRFNGAWTGSEAMFRDYQDHGAPVGFAPDPNTAHECGDSRYLAIPFFDACLELRLPASGNTLKPVRVFAGWFAPFLGDKATPAVDYQGKKLVVWLPTEAVARAWEEYVKTGATTDTTPPPAPTAVTITPTKAGSVLTWDATADFESGLRNFVIVRDGEEIGQLPAKPVGRFGRPLFQQMSYHDTPEKPLPVMRFLDPNGPPGAKYEVMAVNSLGLKSAGTTAKLAD